MIIISLKASLRRSFTNCFVMLKTFLLQIPEILLTYRAVSLHWKTFPFSFSRFKAFLTHLLNNFIILKSLYSNLVCWKGFAIFLFLTATSNNQDGKIRKNIFFREWQRKRNTCLRPKNYQFIISHEIYLIPIVI